MATSTWGIVIEMVLSIASGLVQVARDTIYLLLFFGLIGLLTAYLCYMSDAYNRHKTCTRKGFNKYLVREFTIEDEDDEENV